MFPHTNKNVLGFIIHILSKNKKETKEKERLQKRSGERYQDLSTEQTKKNTNNIATNDVKFFLKNSKKRFVDYREKYNMWKNNKVS